MLYFHLISSSCPFYSHLNPRLGVRVLAVRMLPHPLTSCTSSCSAILCVVYQSRAVLLSSFLPSSCIPTHPTGAHTDNTLALCPSVGSLGSDLSLGVLEAHRVCRQCRRVVVLFLSMYGVAFAVVCLSVSCLLFCCTVCALHQVTCSN